MNSPRIAASLALGLSLLSWLGSPLPSRADQSQGDTAPEAAPEPELAAEPEPSPWAATVELYGFGPLRTTGTTTIRGFSSDVDLDLGQALDALEWATSVRGSLERGRWGLLSDLSYVRLGNESGRTTPRGLLSGNTDIRSTQGIYDLALRYRLGEPEAAVAHPGSYSLIPYVGARLIDVSLQVQAEVRGNDPRQRQLSATREFGRTWVQPLVGIQGSYFLSPRLRAFARADLGGFDFSSAADYSGNAQVGLGYAIGENTDLNLSWRYLGLNYNNGNQRDSGFTSYQNGVEIGLKFFF
ncbi:MAG: hypothetical protein VKJ66_10830 [Synechococcus sp.]|nr:hypothetical protein [Synechococcus sp.]